MEFDEHSLAEEQDNAVEIYSKRAIFWFALLLGPLFGAVLLMINLREVGYKKASKVVLLFTILFDCITELSLFFYVKYSHIDLLALQKDMMDFKPNDKSFLDERFLILTFLALGLRVIGALIISRYFFKRYFPDKDYYAKSIANILLISIGIWLFLQFIGLGGI